MGLKFHSTRGRGLNKVYKKEVKTFRLHYNEKRLYYNEKRLHYNKPEASFVGVVWPPRPPWGVSAGEGAPKAGASREVWGAWEEPEAGPRRGEEASVGGRRKGAWPRRLGGGPGARH